MKRNLVAFFLAALLTFSFAACSNNSNAGRTGTTPPLSSVVVSQPDVQPSAQSAYVSPFAPNPVYAGAATVTTDKDAYALGEEVMVKVIIHSPELFPNGMLFGIYDPARRNHTYMTGAGSETVESGETKERGFEAKKAGYLEVRLYAAFSDDCNEENLVAVIPIAVGEDAFVPDVIGEIIQLGGMDWRILDVQDGKAFVLSEYLVNSGPFHMEYDANPSWETSDLRSYLNGEFYDRFSEDEKARILETSGISSYNLWFERNVGNVTTDRIFLLSAEEVIKYIFHNNGEIEETEYGEMIFRSSEPGDGLLARMENSSGQHYDWWLRTVGSGEMVPDPEYGGTDFLCANFNVGPYALHLSGLKASSSPSGIRPAMWITL